MAPSATRANEVLRLEDAVRKAHERAFEILLQRERIVDAEIAHKKAWALLLPTWSATFNYTRREPAPPATKFPSLPDFSREAVQTGCVDAVSEACIRAVLEEIARSGQQPGLDLDLVKQDSVLASTQIQWSILNGRALPQLEASERSVDLEQRRLAIVERAIELKVAMAFFAATAAERTVETTTRAEARSRSRLELERQRAALGQSSESGLRLAQIHSEIAGLDVQRARAGLAQAKSSLARLIGVEGAYVLAPPPSPEVPSGDRASWIRAATHDRAEIAVADAAVELAETGLDDVFWRYFPIGSLFASYRVSNTRGLSGQADEWTFGVNAQWTLFDGGLRYREREEAESRIRAAGINRDRDRQNIADEVDTAAERLEQATLQAARAERGVALAHETLHVATTQLGAGTLREIDVREAADTVRDAELAVVSAKLERDLAILRLRWSLGL